MSLVTGPSRFPQLSPMNWTDKHTRGNVTNRGGLLRSSLCRGCVFVIGRAGLRCRLNRPGFDAASFFVKDEAHVVNGQC